MTSVRGRDARRPWALPPSCGCSRRRSCALIRTIITWREGLVAHRSRLLLQKRIGLGLTVALHVAQSFGVAVLGVGLETQVEVASEVGSLNEKPSTMGLEVVWWQKVDPVGLMLGGNLDL